MNNIAKQLTALRIALTAEGNDPEFVNGICVAYIQVIASCMYTEKKEQTISTYTPKTKERRES